MIHLYTIFSYSFSVEQIFIFGHKRGTCLCPLNIFFYIPFYIFFCIHQIKKNTMTLKLSKLQKSVSHIKLGKKIQIQFKDIQQENRDSKQTQSNFKLPFLKMNRLLNKIGGISKHSREDLQGKPSDESMSYHHKMRYQQLKDRLSHKKSKSRAYDGELDDIVLNCYRPGVKNTNKSVWNQYKENHLKLQFQIFQILSKK